MPDLGLHLAAKVLAASLPRRPSVLPRRGPRWRICCGVDPLTPGAASEDPLSPGGRDGVVPEVAPDAGAVRSMPEWRSHGGDLQRAQRWWRERRRRWETKFLEEGTRDDGHEGRAPRRGERSGRERAWWRRRGGSVLKDRAYRRRRIDLLHSCLCFLN